MIGSRLDLTGQARGRWAQFRALVRSREVFLVGIAAVAGVLAGVLVSVISGISQLAHVFFFGINLDEYLSASARISPLTALTVPPLAGLLLGGMEYWRRRMGLGPAVDPVEANALRGGQMSLRDSIVVTVQTMISNGAGASVGLEAAYTQMGGGLASKLGQYLRLRRGDMRIVVGAGAAGAIAAAFGAPLTGAFYAFELIIGVYSVASVAPIMAAAVAAVLTTEALGGAPYEISILPLFAVRLTHFPLIIVLGLLVASLGILVMRSLPLIERAFELSKAPYWLRPAIGGLIVGGLALVTPQVLAAGHGALLQDLPVSMPMTALAGIIALKLIASMVSLGSGFRGGLFFASLFVGALCGKLFSLIMTLAFPELGLDPTICILVGMGALAVAIVGGPLTMTFLVLETTQNFTVTGAVLTACVASSLYVRETFGYSFSTWRLHLRGETIRSAHDVGWVRLLTVGKMMRSDPPTIAASASLAEFRRRYPLGSTHAVIVLDEQGRYAGVLSTPQAFAIDQAEASKIKVSEVVKTPDIALTPDQNVKDAMAAFDLAERETLAVVEDHTSLKVLGILTEKHASKRYADELDRASRGIIGE
jgi:CIC family chloride channel protein